MRRIPAQAVAVATVLALSSACAVAPSPPPSEAPTTSPAAWPSAPPREIVFLGWATRAGGTELLAVDARGAVATRALPAAPNGPLVSGVRGPLAFLSGPPGRPVLWTADRPLFPQWTARDLTPPGPQAEPLRWACVGPGRPGEVAVQSNDTALYLVEPDGRLRSLARPHGLFRPGGCAWPDPGHVLVPLDIPNSDRGIAFATIGVDDGATNVLFGGGEDPATSDVSLAHVFREGGRSLVVVRAIPTFEGPLPAPTARIEPDGDADFFRPALAADGTRIAVLERDARGRPRQLIVYDLTGEPSVLLRVDVRDAADAGPVWIDEP